MNTSDDTKSLQLLLDICTGDVTWQCYEVSSNMS